jgi:hypothetical protein
MGDGPPTPAAPPTAGPGDAPRDLVPGLHLRATPLGAFRSASARVATPEVAFVRRLLRERRSPALTPEVVAGLAGAAPGADDRAAGDRPAGDARDAADAGVDVEAALGVLGRLQDRAWVEGHAQPLDVTEEALEVGLARTLPPLSSRGRALLADRQGFCLASTGFAADTAAVVAAFSADLVATTERHAHRLDRAEESGAPGTGAVGLVDGFGNSQLGFWPLFVGSQRFVLALAGVPRLNRPELVELVTRLSLRYGGDEFGGSPSGRPREENA